LRYLSFAFATIALVFGASSSFAADTDTTTAQQVTVPAPDATAVPAKSAMADDPNAIVCKRLAPETGTRLGSRTQCRTKAEWDAISREAQEGLRAEQQRGSATPGGH
jgi:hypothetical protein